MSFKYSVCYPNKVDIAYFDLPISKEEALEIAKNYPWLEQLKIKGDHYNPSIDFTNIRNNRSFCLTAAFSDNNDLNFSLWYNRPKKAKVLFGLFGEKEKMEVDDYWSVDLNSALDYLEHFLIEDYNHIEKLFT